MRDVICSACCADLASAPRLIWDAFFNSCTRASQGGSTETTPIIVITESVTEMSLLTLDQLSIIDALLDLR